MYLWTNLTALARQSTLLTKRKSLTPSKHSSWWRRLSSSSSRCLDQDKYIHLSHRSSENIFVKTNISVLAIRLQDVYKTSSRRPQDVLQKCLQDIFKTSCKNVFKTSLRHWKSFWRRLQDISKMFCKDVFKKFSRHMKWNCPY